MAVLLLLLHITSGSHVSLTDSPYNKKCVYNFYVLKNEWSVLKSPKLAKNLLRVNKMCLQAVKKQEKRKKCELENVEKELVEKAEVLKKGSQ